MMLLTSDEDHDHDDTSADGHGVMVIDYGAGDAGTYA